MPKVCRVAPLGNKLKNALDEARILILGGAGPPRLSISRLHGARFERIPTQTQELKVLGLLLLLTPVALLFVPVARHRLVERGDESTSLVVFTGRIRCLALLPFAEVLGIDLFTAAEKIMGRALGVAAGSLVSALALSVWHDHPLLARGEAVHWRTRGTHEA